MSNSADGFNGTEKNQRTEDSPGKGWSKQMYPYIKWPKVNQYLDKPADKAHHMKKKGIFPIPLPTPL